MTITNIFPIPAFKDNYIWTWLDENSKTAWVVDPGDAKPVIATLDELGYDLAGILLTHHHWDHSGGIRDLLKHWQTIPVFGSYESSISEITHRVKEGDDVNCLPFKLNVLEIPGHTLDHVAYFNNEVLYCGDTLFSAGCGRVFEGTYEQMYQSLTKIMQLPDDIKIYCGHEYTLANLQFAGLVEPHNADIKAKLEGINRLQKEGKPTLPSILSGEKRLNPFLRCTKPEVIHSVERYANKQLSNSIEVFRYLREWKNRL